jgi:hypothetical protein
LLRALLAADWSGMTESSLVPAFADAHAGELLELVRWTVASLNR